MALAMREDAWATWKPKTPEANKSEGTKKLTMPPVAIECVRNIRREALASFWEASHVAKQNVTTPIRAIQPDVHRVPRSASERPCGHWS